MSPRLRTIANAVNRLTTCRAVIVPGYCNTDRKIRGSRLRWPGKGRNGNRLIVKDARGRVVVDHNAAETYRSNDEALRKVKDACGVTLADVLRVAGRPGKS